MPDNTETLSPAVPVFAAAIWFIKRRVKSVEIAAVQMILNDAETFPEPLEMDDFPCPEEFYGIIDVRIVFDQPEDIIVGSSGFLFCCQILCQIGDGIAGGLEGSGRKRSSAGCLRPETSRVIHIVIGESLFFDLLCSQVSGQLMNNSADHFHMV